MNDNNDIIPIGQMVFILMMTIVGTGILALPRALAEAVPYDHILILLAGALISLATVFVHGAIIRLSPGEAYFQILCKALTRPIGYVVGFAYVVYFIGITGLVTRIFSEVIKSYLLINTPIEVISIGLLGISIYMARKGVEVLGRMLEFIFPFIAVVTTFIFLLSFGKADFSNLLPIFKIKVGEIVKNAHIPLFSFIGFEVLLFFGCHLKDPKQATKASIAILAVFFFYAGIVALTIVQFGTIQLKYLVWPTLDLFDTIEFPGLFIENLQVIVMSLWVLTVFSSIAPMHLATTVMVKSLTGSRDQAYLAGPFLPLAYLASIIPENVTRTHEIMGTYSQYFSSVMVFLVPFIVLISLLLQKRFNKERQANV